MAGADPPKHLLAGDEFNETGYWESDRLWQLHDELLQDMGVAWNSLLAYPSSFFNSPKANRYNARIIEVLRDEYANSALFCLKDPRICRLLPLWMPVLKAEGIEASYVIISRNPLEVAESLKGRFDLHWSESLMLWLRHTLEAERYTRGRRRVFVTYDQVMSDWRSVLWRISERLEIVWPRRPSEIDVGFERIISDRLRHYRVGDDKIDAREDVTEWVASTYRACVAASEDQTEEQIDVFDRVRHEIETADKAFEPLLVIQQIQRDASRAETAAAEARSAVLQAQANEFVTRVEGRESELALAQARLRELEPAAADAVARAEQTAAQLGERDAELAATQAALTAARAETTGAQAQSAEFQAQANELVSRVEERDAELAVTQTRLREMEAAAADAVARADQGAAQLSERDEQLAAAKAELDAARAEAAAAELQLAAARQAEAELAARVEQDPKPAVSGAELERLQRALDFREAEVAEIRSALSLQENARKSEAEAMRTELATSAKELRESRGNLRASEARAESLSTRAAQLTAELALNAEERAEIERRMQVADRELARLREVLERHISRIQSLEDDLAMAQSTAVEEIEESARWKGTLAQGV